MIQTRITRTFTLAGLVPAGKLTHSYRSLLPVLALWLATAAWSQTTSGFTGRIPMRGVSGAVQLAKPAATTPASAQYEFITIEIPGSTGAYAYNINDGRLVTGAYLDANNNWHGFIWQDGIAHTVDHTGSLDTELSAANNDGVGVGLYGDFTTSHAATYSSASGTWTTLPDISGMPINYGAGINNLGVAVEEAGVGNLDTIAYACSVSWIWEPAKYAYSFFTVPGGTEYTCAYGINDKGQVVGGFVDSSGVTHGFLKDGESYTTIDVPGASNTGASWIDNKGEIVGEWFDASGYGHGYVRSPGGQFTIVDVPGTSNSADFGINDRGDLCGYYSDASNVSQAYVAFKL
jgi:probable HAF family extracellular repeat protein